MSVNVKYNSMQMLLIIYLTIINFCRGLRSLSGYVQKTLHMKLNKGMIIDNFPEKFLKSWNIDVNNTKRPERQKTPIRVYSVESLREMIAKGYRVRDLDVRGDTSSTTAIDSDGNNIINSNENMSRIHPVIKTLYERANEKSIPGQRTDLKKVAIAIEGGGMRGCVAAGMITALSHLGIEDSVDVVYGSSAGSLVGAYFISRQLPYDGPEVYYDVLTSAGKDFIDSQSILRSIGLGLFDLRFSSFVSLFTDRMGKPVLNLDYLLNTIVQRIKPLKWDVFLESQVTNKQVLKVVASGLLSKQAVVLSYEEGNFKTLAELSQCMRASMLLPGITGEIARLKGEQAMGNNIFKTWWREYKSRKDSSLIYGSEPMSDALIFEPIPYRSAVRENCTHILVLRTRADGISVTVKMSLVEKLIMSRFFGRKQGLPDLVTWMHKQYHKLLYAEDMLILNRANRDFSELPSMASSTSSSSSNNNNNELDSYNTSTTLTTQSVSHEDNEDVDSVDWDKLAKLYTIALPEGTEEVKRMETSREAIFNNVRYGFAAAYDALVLDPTLQGQGLKIACEIWPDSILLTNPYQHQHDIVDKDKVEFNMSNTSAIVNFNTDSTSTSPSSSSSPFTHSDILKSASTSSSSSSSSSSSVSTTAAASLRLDSLSSSLDSIEKALLGTPALKLPIGKRKALISTLRRLQSFLLGQKEE